MECKHCGAETSVSTFYCGGCGRPVSFQPAVETKDDPPLLLSDVPAPGPSLESPDAPAPEAAETGSADRALCSLCMGAYPRGSLSVVDGKPYCADCNPMKARRVQHTDAPPAPEWAESPAGVRSFQFEEAKPGGGGGKAILVILVLVILGGGGFAAMTFLGRDRIDALMAGVDGDRLDAALLVQKYQAGDRLTYSMSIQGMAEVNGLGGVLPMGSGGTLEMDMFISGIVQMEVVSVDDRGNAQVAVSLQGFRPDITARMNGEEVPMPGQAPGTALDGRTVVLTLDPFGEVVSSPQGGEEVQDLLSCGFEGMPHRELKVGDTWTTQEKLPKTGPGAQFLGGAEPSINATYVVEGFKRVKDRDCMVISVTGAIEGLDSLPQMPTADMQMDVDMKGVLFFDPEAGLMVQGAVDVDMRFSAVRGDESFDMEMDMSIDIELR